MHPQINISLNSVLAGGDAVDALLKKSISVPYRTLYLAFLEAVWEDKDIKSDKSYYRYDQHRVKYSSSAAGGGVLMAIVGFTKGQLGKSA